MRTEYWIERTEENTQIERQTEPSVALHYVLWSHQMVEAAFADGVRVRHREADTLIQDPTVERSSVTTVALKPGERRRIIIEEE